MINTKKVEGRRQIRYQSLDDLLADAERLAKTEVHTLGNWSQGQIYMHLARALNASIDGIEMSFPAPLRWIMTLLMKRKFLYHKVPAGFSAPKGPMQPGETSVAEGLAVLQEAVARQKEESSRVMHPGLGHLTRDEWNAFNLRHAELHMSFLV